MTVPVFGWREWASLLALGAPAVLAKLDTGARTGALHATRIEEIAAGRLRFILHGDSGAETMCEAELVERRAVRSSNGRVEVRPVIRTPVSIGGLEPLVELTLTDRSAMRHRLLLGRKALAAFGALVDPTRTELQPRQAEPLGGIGRSTPQPRSARER